jgi:hypothetical protein
MSPAMPLAARFPKLCTAASSPNAEPWMVAWAANATAVCSAVSTHPIPTPARTKARTRIGTLVTGRGEGAVGEQEGEDTAGKNKARTRPVAEMSGGSARECRCDVVGDVRSRAVLVTASAPSVVVSSLAARRISSVAAMSPSSNRVRRAARTHRIVGWTEDTGQRSDHRQVRNLARKRGQPWRQYGCLQRRQQEFGSLGSSVEESWAAVSPAALRQLTWAGWLCSGKVRSSGLATQRPSNRNGRWVPEESQHPFRPHG